MEDNFNFTYYDKISDTLIYFNNDISLKFIVSLNRKGADGNIINFHNEYSYDSSYFGKKSYAIRRYFVPYFSLDDKRDFKNNIMIKPSDVCLLQLVMNNNIIPWVMGNSRIYGMDKEGKIIIKGKWSQADFPLSDYQYLSFIPIVVTYDDNTTKEGIRMVMNNKDNFIDMDINKFMEFYYYINNTDIYNAAIGLVNYVKTQPYCINGRELPQSFNNKPSKNFFNSI